MERFAVQTQDGRWVEKELRGWAWHRSFSQPCGIDGRSFLFQRHDVGDFPTKIASNDRGQFKISHAKGTPRLMGAGVPTLSLNTS